MKKFIVFLMLLALSASPAYAGIGTYEDGTYEGETGGINAGDDLNITISGNYSTIELEDDIAPTHVRVGTSLYLPYYSKLTRPASGGTDQKGEVILFAGANASDCGVDNTGANTNFHLCVSDGTNWIAV